MSQEENPRRRQIDNLLDVMVAPETSLDTYYELLHERAILIREEAEKMGISIMPYSISDDEEI